MLKHQNTRKMSPPHPFLVLLLALVVLATMAGCGGGGGSAPNSAQDSLEISRMIGPDRRLAVRNECWYALDRDWLNNPNPTAEDQEGPKAGKYVAGYGGNAYTAKAGWAYIKTDGNNNAPRFTVRKYNRFTTNIMPDQAFPDRDVEYWVNRVVNDDYALGNKNIGNASSKFPNYGHGLQCPSFVSMIIYRARQGYDTGNMNAQRLTSDGPASNAKPGDVVFNTKIGGGWGHTAICVRNAAGILTVVDSNYVGGDGQELIARHDIEKSDMGNWKLYSGKGRWY